MWWKQSLKRGQGGKEKQSDGCVESVPRWTADFCTAGGLSGVNLTCYTCAWMILFPPNEVRKILGTFFCPSFSIRNPVLTSSHAAQGSRRLPLHLAHPCPFPFRFYIESISYLKDNATIELFFLNAKSCIYKVGTPLPAVGPIQIRRSRWKWAVPLSWFCWSGEATYKAIPVSKGELHEMKSSTKWRDSSDPITDPGSAEVFQTRVTDALVNLGLKRLLSELQGGSSVPFPFNVWNTHTFVLIFFWGAGDWIQSLTHARQVLCYIPSLPWPFLSVQPPSPEFFPSCRAETLHAWSSNCPFPSLISPEVPLFFLFPWIWLLVAHVSGAPCNSCPFASAYLLCVVS